MKFHNYVKNVIIILLKNIYMVYKYKDIDIIKILLVF